jgi:CPA2 family monovalent cation:H+ antiporter-2
VVGGIVLGLAVSVASTVVLLRALGVFTVLVLVLLPTVAPLLHGGGGVDASVALLAIAVALLKVGAFAVLMLVLGVRVVPRLLDWVASDGSRELFTLAVLAVAIGIAVAAYAVFGVSFALGAFLAGIVLNESEISHRAAEDALPLRDAFAVLFFVSVGMLLDPSFLMRQPLAIVAIVLLIVVAKAVAAFFIVAALRHPVQVGLTVAAALAQVGEFSFILATLALSLELIPEDAFQLVVAGSLVSITLNPFLYRLVPRAVQSLQARPGLLGALEGSGASR